MRPSCVQASMDASHRTVPASSRRNMQKARFLRCFYTLRYYSLSTCAIEVPKLPVYLETKTRELFELPAKIRGNFTYLSEGVSKNERCRIFRRNTVNDDNYCYITKNTSSDSI